MSSLGTSLYLAPYANKMVLMILWVEEVFLCDPAADMGMCSWLQEGQMVMEAGDWEGTYGKYHYMLTLAWIVFLWHYILEVSVSWKTSFNHKGYAECDPAAREHGPCP